MKNKTKIVLSFLCLLLITGCTKNLQDENKNIVKNEKTGQTITENILCAPTSEETINIYKENNVDLTSLSQCENFSITDGGYEGLWTSIFVKPLAWGIIKIGKIVKNYGLALIIATLLIRLIVMPLTKKTAVQSENMKEAKPALDRLEQKYKGKEDKEAQMQKAQEMMAIYKKYNISPASGCILAFIQLPLFFAFLEAINRVPAIFEGTFLGLQMGTNPSVGISNGNYFYIIYIVLIIGTTYFSFSQTMNDQAAMGNGKQGKLMKYFLVGFIGIASFTLPLATAIYWISSSLFTIFQNEIVKRKKVQNETK